MAAARTTRAGFCVSSAGRSVHYSIITRSRGEIVAGRFDHSVMILEVRRGLAASSLSPTLLQGYSRDVPAKSDACRLSLSPSYC